MSTSQVQAKRELSEEELSNIKMLREYARPDDSKFLKMKDGEVRVFYFDPSPTKIRKYEAEDKFNEGKIRKQIQFDVVDPNTSKEHTLSLSRTHAEKILRQLEKGNLILTIERIGDDKSTDYDVSASD